MYLGAAMIVQNTSNTHGFVLIACVSLACLLLASATGTADAQSYTSILVLDPAPSSAVEDDRITFSGQLTTTSGHVVTGATIQIKDDVSFGRDRTIATAYTDDNGEFYASWTVQSRSGAYDFYATYEGSSNISSARSQTHSMTVSSGTANDYGSTRASSIVLYGIPSAVYAGTQVAFSGQLTSNGQPLDGKFVMIYDDDPGPDDVIGYGWTNSNGYFSIPWTAEQGLVEKELEIYAVFDGDGDYERDRSANQEMSIVKYGGSITLDPIPSSAKIGQLITFSGTLSLDNVSPRGAVVYIKDEDFGSRDELLATGYVDGNGRFSASWIADYTDTTNNTVDVFAVFEGDGVLSRLTTCGFPCASGTTQIRISGVVTPPTPPDPGSGEYIELFYSLDFTRSPHVAIVPDPDSYNNVKSHIIPAQEGIMMWTADLERRYGGNWDVTFDVVTPGERFDSRPDIIMNLVTHERDDGCLNDYYGWADIYRSWNPFTAPKFSSPPKSIDTTVCSTSGDQQHSNYQVSGTAAHEFIHAVGLGHTFNKPGDMMCSVEDGVPTCDSARKVYEPSNLNLAGVAHIYGADGFSNPNNNVAYKDRFHPDGSSSSSEPSTVPLPVPSSPACERTDFTYDWTINEFELESGWYQWYTICGSPISYSFSTSSSYDGVSIYVLPPDTDVSDFVNNREGSYYVCEEPDSQWHKKSNTCNILPGSSIVLHNTMERAIDISGWIWTPT